VIVSEQLPDVSPAFALDTGVVVVVISSASGELDGLFSFGKVPLEVIVEERTSVITIEAQYVE
jgi:hypothetical protein